MHGNRFHRILTAYRLRGRIIQAIQRNEGKIDKGKDVTEYILKEYAVNLSEFSTYSVKLSRSVPISGFKWSSICVTYGAVRS